MNELKFTLKDCDEVIKQRLNLTNVTTIDYEAIPRQKDNFIIKITINNNSKEETFYFYAKSNSKPPKIDKILYEDFKTSLPSFDPSFTPKYYCGKSDLLLFEDVTCQRFQPELDTFTLNHFRQALNVLAEFHAAGFAYEEIKAKKLDKEYSLSTSNFDLSKTEDILRDCLENKERVAEVLKDLEERQSCSKFKRILCHSNLTSDNMLFHYENGVPDNCKLLNFKAELYAPPVYDVLQLIFFNSNEELRRHHYQSLLFYYHNCLKEAMEKYQLDINKILSVDHLLLSSHTILPLIKLEVVLKTSNYAAEKNALDELKEILACSRLSREDCYSIINNRIKSTDYDLLSFTLTDDWRLKIKIRYSLVEESIDCVVKSVLKVPTGFNKEIFIYNSFIPILSDLEVHIINDCLPFSYLQRLEDLVVFEDMYLLCYQLLPTASSLDFYSLALVVKKLAKFHACSLIFEEKMSEELKRTYRVADDYSQYFEEDVRHKSVTDIINLIPEVKTKTRDENLKKCLPRLTHIFSTSSKTSERFRNVISHGNIKSDNVLVKFDDNKLVDCRFINYEKLKYCPPAYDFLSVIYMTDRTNRKCVDKLMKIYYDELNQIISSFGYNLSRIMSHEEFVESVDAIRPAILMKIIFRGQENPQEMSKDKLKETLLELYDQCEVLLSKP